MIGIFILLLISMLLVIKFCKKTLKVVLSIIIILVTLYCVIISIDINRVESFKEPIFVVAGETADDGGSGIYYGLGYKVKIEKTISAQYGPALIKVEMYIFDKLIASAIANHNTVDENHTIIEDEQYEFLGTIIKVHYNSIIVEPEEGTNERKSSDKISVNITRPTDGTNDFYLVGNKVKITYNGIIMESYPAQINSTKIELVN